MYILDQNKNKLIILNNNINIEESNDYNIKYKSYIINNYDDINAKIHADVEYLSLNKISYQIINSESGPFIMIKGYNIVCKDLILGSYIDYNRAKYILTNDICNAIINNENLYIMPNE